MQNRRPFSTSLVLCLIVSFLSVAPAIADSAAPDLRVGTSFHAFDHLDKLGRQAEAAAACGVTIIYATGVGEDGYLGLPPAADWMAHRTDCAGYVQHAKSLGIKMVLGYLCSTSIVDLDTFAKNWTDEQRAEFRTTPDTWLQQDIGGKPLPSWYGGKYNPACMNNPDWRVYERYMVRAQIETGHGGVFFDNPTVHPKGCYCPHCMKGFAAFLRSEGIGVGEESLDALRKLTSDRASDFKRYRCTIARDFIEDMRACARNVNPNAVVTANNSLNSPGSLFAQCHSYAYNIQELSKTEDLVVVEDMSTQPRVLPDGKIFECAPSYKQLHAISHQKPIVAVTIAEADYHTPPNLICLAMTEAAAHQASYMLWATWPDEMRPKMVAAVRPYADWLRSHADLLNAMMPRNDVMLFLPFRQWVNTESCAVSELAAQLSRRNIQYGVFSEDDFESTLSAKPRVLLMEKLDVLIQRERETLASFEKSGGKVMTSDSSKWVESLLKEVGQPSLCIEGPETVRGIVADLPGMTAVWLYNLNVQRLSSYEDKVIPAEDLAIRVRVPFTRVDSVILSSADKDAPSGKVDFTTEAEDESTTVQFGLDRLRLASLIVIRERI